MPAFMPGLLLSERFYTEAVQPILAAHFPRLRYGAARLDSGSDVLGFDTPRSTDHDWGPRLTLFLEQADLIESAAAIGDVLGRELPPTFCGYSTHFGPPDAEGSRLLADPGQGPIAHRVERTTLATFLGSYLGYDLDAPLDVATWLTMPEQRLRTIRSGRVFHDGLDQLEALRCTLHYYPDDVWRYLLAAQWTRIAQEEPFMGRCGDVGDPLGSRLVALRLVRDVIKLCFLMERQYAPYTKWFGTGFAQLEMAAQLQPLFDGVLSAGSWQEREGYLSQVYEIVAGRHNALQLTPPLDPHVSPFHTRPYLVIHGERFAQALLQTIQDEHVRAIRTLIGGVDQFADSTDLLTRAHLCQRLRVLYD